MVGIFALLEVLSNALVVACSQSICVVGFVFFGFDDPVINLSKNQIFFKEKVPSNDIFKSHGWSFQLLEYGIL